MSQQDVEDFKSYCRQRFEKSTGSLRKEIAAFREKAQIPDGEINKRLALTKKKQFEMSKVTSACVAIITPHYIGLFKKMSRFNPVCMNILRLFYLLCYFDAQHASDGKIIASVQNLLDMAYEQMSNPYFLIINSQLDVVSKKGVEEFLRSFELSELETIKTECPFLYYVSFYLIDVLMYLGMVNQIDFAIDEANREEAWLRAILYNQEKIDFVEQLEQKLEKISNNLSK